MTKIDYIINTYFNTELMAKGSMIAATMATIISFIYSLIES